MGRASGASPEERGTVAPTDFGPRTVSAPPQPSGERPDVELRHSAVCQHLPQNISLTQGAIPHTEVCVEEAV